MMFRIPDESFDNACEFREFISRYCKCAAEVLASQQETLILTGCHFCGRRLIHDGELIEGVRIVYDECRCTPSGSLGKPCCSDCFSRVYRTG